MGFTRFVHRLYQYYQIATSFLYFALLARWIILFPLVGKRFLPGGIHEFLIYLMFFSSIIEILWLLKFRGVKGTVINRTFLKDLNFMFFVGVMHFYDDYEHALVLKNIAYSVFVVSLSCDQCYSHLTKLFKRESGGQRRSLWWKLDSFLAMPILYLSEFYLLLLNIQNPNFHSTPLLNQINNIVLVLYLPIAITLYRQHLKSSPN